MHDVGESIHTQGSLSHFEFFLISAIIQYSHSDVQNWEDVKNVDLLFIANNYSATKVLAKALNLNLPIFGCSNVEINSAIKHVTNHSLKYFINCIHRHVTCPLFPV